MKKVSEKRRRLGQFYTPTPFVDEAHRRISRAFGEGWKEEYVVVDCAAGTKNLTRDYRFGELYSSTLEQAELDIGARYNPEAVSFRYDFLNESLEDLERKAPGLVKAFRENRKIVFFINPPYLQNSVNAKCDHKSAVFTEMTNAKIGGKRSSNLYAQFLYRIMSIKRKFGLTDCNLAFFCNPNYLTGSAYEKFRNEFLKEFRFDGGMLFNAGHFADCSALLASLSPEAKAVLDKATELTEKSMKFRSAFNDDRPECQIMNWDASYYQLKQMWKTFMPEELKEFRGLVKSLADKMRPMVYELGFLRK